MRIGIVFCTADEMLSGVEWYTINLLKALLQLSGNDRYVVFTNAPRLLGEHCGACANLAIRSIGRLGGRPLRVLWQQTSLLREAKRAGLDVLHSPCYVGPVWPSGTPSVVTIHDTIALDHPAWCKTANWLHYRMLMKASALRASVVIVPSGQTACDVEHRLGIDRAKIRMIYPGIDPVYRQRQSAFQREGVRRRYGLPERYILTVGNLEPKKNIPQLLRAFDLLGRQGLELGLVVVGGRRWKEGAVVREMGRSKERGIVMTGYVPQEDLPAIYQMADVYVCASLHEGFGLPPLEAMASGVPVVSSGRGALGETLGDAALPIATGGAGEIAQSIARVLTDQVTGQECITKGLQRCARFDWAQPARQTRLVYEEAAGLR